MTESVLMAVLGGLAGLGLGWLGLKGLIALAPADLPRLDDMRIDGRVLAFTAGISLLTGLLFGLAPALLAFNASHANDPSVTFVWIAREYTDAAIRRWVDEVDPPGIVLLDPGERASEAYRTTGQPETYAIDPGGVVRNFYPGPVTVRDLEALLLTATVAA